MSGDKTTEAAEASSSRNDADAKQKGKEAKTLSSVRMTSDGDAYVHLGSWAARKSKDPCGKQSQNISSNTNATKQEPAPQPTIESAPNKDKSSDEEFVIIN